MVRSLKDDEYSRRPRVTRRQVPCPETQAPLENQLTTSFAAIAILLVYHEKMELIQREFTKMQLMTHHIMVNDSLHPSNNFLLQKIYLEQYQ